MGAQKESPTCRLGTREQNSKRVLKSATRWDHFVRGHSLTYFNSLKMVPLLKPSAILRIYNDYLVRKEKVKNKIQ